MISSRSNVEIQSKVKTPVAQQAAQRFDASDLETLRLDMLQSGLDTWQAADLITMFLSGRGYGVSNDAARNAAVRMEESGCSVECMQMELEKLALVM